MHDQPHSIHFLISTAPTPAMFYVQVPQDHLSIVYPLTYFKSRGTKAFADSFSSTSCHALVMR